ncbi:MAG: DNA-binding protein, partial [Nitrospirota bacterium]|nr:DNA-binding protein [Nitrospirota bacterium]
MSRVAVSEDVLRWVVSRSGLTPDDLHYKFPHIDQWVKGEAQPTLRQLETLAKATLTPLGFFFLKTPPEERLPIPHFRTHDEEAPSKPSPNLIETIRMMQRRQAWMREFLIEQGQDPLPTVRSAKPQEQPVAVAEHIRRALKLEEGWAAHKPTWTDALRRLREAIEHAGILIVF